MFYNSNTAAPFHRQRRRRFRPRWPGRGTRQRRGFTFKSVVVLTVLACLVISMFPDLDAEPYPEARPQVGAHDASVSGRVTHVRDGDTIEVGQTAIRFKTLDCPERGKWEGDRATQMMTALARGQQVTCSLIGRKSYDREIGSCQLADGRDLAAWMIESGTCQRYR